MAKRSMRPSAWANPNGPPTAQLAAPSEALRRNAPRPWAGGTSSKSTPRAPGPMDDSSPASVIEMRAEWSINHIIDHEAQR